MGKQSSLERKISQHPHFVTTEFGKIRCTLTGHEIPMRTEDFEEYLQVRFSLTEEQKLSEGSGARLQI